MRKQRFDALDIMKAWCILAVMATHCIAVESIGVMTVLCMGSSMILFFLISGYTYKEGRSVKNNILKRGKQLLIPFVKYSAVICILCGILWIGLGEVDFHEYLKYVKGFYLSQFSEGEANRNNILWMIMPYWFLIVMFLASTVFFPIADFALRSGKRLVTVSVVLLGISAWIAECTTKPLPQGTVLTPALAPQYMITYIPWGVQLVPAFAGILLIGAYAGKKQLLLKLQFQGRKQIVFMVVNTILSILLSATCGFAIMLSMGFWGNFGGLSVFIAVLQGIIQMFMLYAAAEIVSKHIRIKKILIWIGRRSLQFYVVHMFIAYLVRRITGWPLFLYGSQYVVEAADIIKTLLLFVVTVCLTALWAWMCENYDILIRRWKRRGLGNEG